MLSQLMYWCKFQGWDTWIFKTRDQWTLELGLTRTEQENARKHLRERGLIEESRKGVPAKLHFRVNKSALNTAFYKLFTSKIQSAGNPPTGRQETRQLDGRKPANKSAGFQPGGKPATQMAGNLPTSNRRLLKGLQVIPTPTPSCEEGGLSKADEVSRDCNWTNPKLTPVIDSALAQHATQNSGSIEDAARLMVENWRLFQECGPYLRFVWGPRRWIRDGHWVNTEGWPVDWETMRRENSARVGMR